MLTWAGDWAAVARWWRAHSQESRCETAAGTRSRISRSVRSVCTQGWEAGLIRCVITRVSRPTSSAVMCLKLCLTSCRKSSSLLMAWVYQELTWLRCYHMLSSHSAHCSHAPPLSARTASRWPRLRLPGLWCGRTLFGRTTGSAPGPSPGSSCQHPGSWE